MLKGSLSRLNEVLENNNIEVIEIEENKHLKLNHITYVIINSSHYYVIDNNGFRTSEESIRPSLLLEKIQNDIQKHIDNEVVEIKVIGDLNKFNNKSYEEVLSDYRRIKSRYDKGLKDSLPTKYKDVCDTLNKLEKGCIIKFISGQKEHEKLIKGFGAAIGSKEIIFMRNTIK